MSISRELVWAQNTANCITRKKPGPDRMSVSKRHERAGHVSMEEHSPARQCPGTGVGGLGSGVRAEGGDAAY